MINHKSARPGKGGYDIELHQFIRLLPGKIKQGHILPSCSIAVYT